MDYDVTTPWFQRAIYGIVLPSLAGVAAFAAIVLTGDATGIRLLVAGVVGIATSTLLFHRRQPAHVPKLPEAAGREQSGAPC